MLRCYVLLRGGGRRTLGRIATTHQRTAACWSPCRAAASSTDTVTSTEASAPSASSRSFFAQKWNERIDKFTNFRKRTYTSTDARGPQYGIGYDPVVNHQLFQSATGPLRRKRGAMTRAEDCFSPEEASRWMETKQAAKVLSFKEDDLPTLTRDALEERWIDLYKQRSSLAHREEILIATEVLLEYLDSTVFVKKNRLYYHQVLDNARIAVDMELEKQRMRQREIFMWLCGLAATGACALVILAAYIKGSISVSQVEKIGSNAGEYLTMSFLQPRNFEPAPDYNTRYFTTPSALEAAQAEVQQQIDHEMAAATRPTGTGTEAMQPASSTGVVSRGLSANKSAAAAAPSLWDSTEERELRQQKLDHDRAEAHELLQMLNDAKQSTSGAPLSSHAVALERAGRNDEVLRHASSSLSPSPEKETSGDGASPSLDSDAAVARRARVVAPPESFAAFAGTLSANYGGGSRLQRMVSETNKSIALREETAARAAAAAELGKKRSESASG